MKNSRLIIFLISVFGVTTLSGQKQFSNQNNVWIGYFGNHKLSNTLGLHTEYQWRRSDYFENWQQSLLRLGLDYNGKTFQITAGYGWIKTFPYGGQPIAHEFNEHRIWEQLVLKQKTGRIDLQHRYRLEQRFLEQWMPDQNQNFEKSGYMYKNRIRYRFQAIVPLTKKEMVDNTLFLCVSDELFLGIGKGIAKNILDQNRFYGGVGWRFNKNCNVQVGYLNQYVVKSDAIKIERNHTLFIGTTYNIDFTAKKEQLNSGS